MVAKTKPAKTSPQLPDERFWVRYSPNHELPVSGAASLLWHVGAFAAIILLGFVMAWRQPNDMPIESVLIEPGGGGNPLGVGNGPGVGNPSALVEAAAQRDLPPDAVLPKTPLADIRDLQITPADILKDLPTDAETTRDISELIERGTQSLEKISKLDKSLRDGLLNNQPGYGQGGPGSGGGKGAGVGKGIGDGTGTGTMNQRTKRKLRWTIMFNTSNGGDYLRQIEVLGAILSFNAADGTIRMIKDLSKRPAAVERVSQEDLAKLNRIFWIDDNQESIGQLIRALGLDESPSQIVALFPLSFEAELLKKELAFRNRTEDSIVETRFQILMRGNRRYEIVVTDQRYK